MEFFWQFELCFTTDFDSFTKSEILGKLEYCRSTNVCARWMFANFAISLKTPPEERNGIPLSGSFVFSKSQPPSLVLCSFYSQVFTWVYKQKCHWILQHELHMRTDFAGWEPDLALILELRAEFWAISGVRGLILGHFGGSGPDFGPV